MCTAFQFERKYCIFEKKSQINQQDWVPILKSKEIFVHCTNNIKVLSGTGASAKAKANDHLQLDGCGGPSQK